MGIENPEIAFVMKFAGWGTNVKLHPNSVPFGCVREEGVGLRGEHCGSEEATRNKSEVAPYDFRSQAGEKLKCVYKQRVDRN
jgi:hypothetical protein